jgi:maleamate amidohydrolase
MNQTGDIDKDYAAAGFGGRLTFGARPALVIVDMVMAYLAPASSLYIGPSGQAALEVTVRLAAACRQLGAPVIFTNVVYQAGGRDGGLFYRKVPALKAFLQGSPLGAFSPDLSPEAGDLIVTKQYASAFFGTSLGATLTAQGIDTAIITGFSTSGCVRATALDALQFGFAPFVVADACADRRPEPHAANLFDLQAKYAEVTTADTLLQALAKASVS